MTKSKRIPSWEGTELVDESGRLVRPFTSMKLFPPATVELELGRIVYRWPPRDPVTPPRDLLERFLRLADGEDGARVLRVAREFGVLGVCEHDVSLLVDPACAPRRMPGTRARDWPKGKYWEPLTLWTQLAREARAILNVLAALERKRRAEDVELDALGKGLSRRFKGESIELQRELFALEVDLWLARSGVRPWISWEGGRRTTGLGFDGVFGAVGAQLYQAVSGAPRAFCAGCGALVALFRISSTGRRNWCGRCRAGRRGSQVARDYRERVKEAIRLHEQGVAASVIALRLGRSVERVQNWIASASIGGPISGTRRRRPRELPRP